MAKAAKSRRYTESDLAKMVRKKFENDGQLVISQARNGVGTPRQERYADALAFSCWPSRGLYFTGFELKSSRTDWTRELRNPEKADGIAKWCRYWYVVGAEDVIDVAEVPETWGYLAPRARGLWTIKAAPKREVEDPPIVFWASVLRNLVQSTFPRLEIDDELKKRWEEGKEYGERWAKRDMEELRESKRRLEVFEKSFGGCLRWTSEGEIERVGKLVKALRTARPSDAIEGATRTLRSALKACEEAAEVLPVEFVRKDKIPPGPAGSEEDAQP